MPRLNHRKAKTGCARCKARKVKCDERRPRCAACERHNVTCEYAPAVPSTSSQQALPTPPRDTSSHVEGKPVDGEHMDHVLEMRLMHEWTAYASKTFSSAWEFWQQQAPLIALEFRYAMDAMLALAALHAWRQQPSQWSPLEGKMVPLNDLDQDPETSGKAMSDRWTVPEDDLDAYRKAVKTTSTKDQDNLAMAARKQRLEMLTVSRLYTDRAIEGQRRAVADLNVSNVEAVYVTSVLVSFAALFMLAESEEGSSIGDQREWAQPTSFDYAAWLRLGRGSRMIAMSWTSFVGNAWMVRSGVFYGKPDLSNEEELFHQNHSKPFQRLLTLGIEYEAMNEEDQTTYQQTLSYIGLIFKGICEGFDEPLTTCRRIIASPSRLPPRFTDLVEQRQPRAMAMLALLFASTKLLENDVIWFKGVSEIQVPRIYDQLPAAWKSMARWPLDIAMGNVTNLNLDNIPEYH